MAQQYYLSKGPWKNWKCSLDDAVARNVDTVRWGTKASSGPDLSNYNGMNIGDMAYFANNTTDPGPFSGAVVFGFGKVVEKFEGTEPYWPDEKKENKVIYKYRFDVKLEFLTSDEAKTVKWFTGLPQPKGFSPIRNQDSLKKLTRGFGQDGMGQQSTFKFVEKDFRCKETKEDAKYRWGRLRDLLDAVIPALGPRFESVKNDILTFTYLGNYWKRGEAKYFDYTWCGMYLEQPPLNPTANKPDFKSREASQNKWKERFQELEVEYENHRRRTLEREQRISRMLQDEIRKGKNAG